MSFSFTVGSSIQGVGNPVTGSVTLTGDAAPLTYSLSIPTGTTNQQVLVAFTLTSLKCLYIQSDVAVTIKTNSTSAPDDTITLQAGRPWHWESGGYFTQPLAAAVTTLYITNSSGSTANIEIRGLIDSTP